MKVLSIVALLFICLWTMNCDSSRGAQCSSALTDAYKKVDLPSLFGLWCQFTGAQQNVILQGLLDFANKKVPDAEPLVTLFGQLSTSQLKVINKTFVQLGLLAPKSDLIGVAGQQDKTRKFIHEKLLPLVLGFFGLPPTYGSA